MKSIALSLVGGIPGALLAVLSKILARPFYEWIAARLIVKLLEEIQESYDNELTRDITEEVKRRLHQEEPADVESS